MTLYLHSESPSLIFTPPINLKCVQNQGSGQLLPPCPWHKFPSKKKAWLFFRDTVHSHWSAHYVVESFYECFRHPLQMPLNLKGDTSLEHLGHNEGELLIRQDHIKTTDDWSSNVHWKIKGNIKLILRIIWHKFWGCLEVVRLCAWLHAVMCAYLCPLCAIVCWRVISEDDIIQS